MDLAKFKMESNERLGSLSGSPRNVDFDLKFGHGHNGSNLMPTARKNIYQWG